MEDNAVLVDELQCRCRPGAKCPKIQLYSDGSVLVTDDEQGATPVRFNREQARQFADFLEKHGAG